MLIILSPQQSWVAHVVHRELRGMSLLSMDNPPWAAPSVLQPCQGHLDSWDAESPVIATTVPVIFPAVVPACHGSCPAKHSWLTVGWDIPRDSHVS